MVLTINNFGWDAGTRRITHPVDQDSFLSILIIADSLFKSRELIAAAALAGI
jgi:hypothetical protein